MKKWSGITEYNAWLLSMERRYPVENWTIDGVHVWPLIRTRLNTYYLTLEKFDAANDGQQPASVPPNLSILGQLRSLLKFMRTSLQSTPVVCSGFSAHRQVLEDRFVNKFFDPVLDHLESTGKQGAGYIVEYGLNQYIPKEYYRSERVIRLFDFLPLLNRIGIYRSRFTKGQFRLESYDQFLDELSANGIQSVHYSPVRLRQSVQVILALKWFWKIFFRKTRAKVTIGLCYYSESMYAMDLAARECNVVSIDLQHGGQGRDHLAYCQFGKLPESKRYDLLPDGFWVWDDTSANDIREWIDRLGAHHWVVQKGNPWIQFLRHHSWPEITRRAPIAVVTLQPVRDPLTPVVIEAMRRVTDVTWFVRLHPRQVQSREEIRRMLQPMPNLEIDLACDLPLPALLGQAKLHVTGSSGSAIEAALLGVPQVIVDDVGVEMFEELIKSGKAIAYLGQDPDALTSLFSSELRKSRADASFNEHDWDFLLSFR